MSKGILACLSFVVGATGGVFATKRYFEDKYRDIANEEIESVREVYERLSGEKEQKVVVATEKKNEVKPDITEYSSIISKCGYDGKEEKEKEEVKPKQNVVIRPDQFGECGYNEVFCTFYKGDEMLGYDLSGEPADDVVDFIESTIGWDGFEENMGKLEEGLLWLRNDDLEIDYEISLDPGKYEELHPES